MKRSFTFVLLLVVFFVMIGPLIAQESDPAYAARGPYAVGYRSFPYGDPDSGRTASLWYPAEPAEGVTQAITYDLGAGDFLPPPMNTLEGRAIADAAPLTENGPYPLIVSSHGNNSSYMMNAYQFEQLASHGFIVFAFDHTLDSFRAGVSAQSQEAQQALMQNVVDSMVMRSLDITDALDFVAALNADDAALAGLIDMERVGMHGLSYGGYTAVMETGARFDFSAAAQFCAEATVFTGITQLVCGLFGQDIPALETRLAGVAGVDVAPGDPWPPLGDARIDAVAALVPGGALPLVSDAGLVAGDKALLMLAGGADPLATPEYNAFRVWDQISSTEKAMATFEQAGHLFAAECSPAMQQAMPICVDPVWDSAVAHDLSNHLVTAFFMAELMGDEQARAALSPDAVSFPGVEYQAEGF